MRPWILVDSGRVPGEGGELQLLRRDDEYAIKVNGTVLMNSHTHGSEQALAVLGCRAAANQERASVLIGGLGMGFTLAATLKLLRPSARVVVAELAPSVIDWNRSVIAHLAGQPLDDARVTVYTGDIANLIRTELQTYDAILLDVDNGPEGLTQKGNSWLYSAVGLQAAKGALKPGGLLGIWSEGPNPPFTQRLKRIGFGVEEARPRLHGRGRHGRCTVWLAMRPT